MDHSMQEVETDSLDLLTNAIKRANLTVDEMNIIYGILALSQERKDFHKSYNEKIDKLKIKKNLPVSRIKNE